MIITGNTQITCRGKGLGTISRKSKMAASMQKEEKENVDDQVQKMFLRIANTDVIVKTQQKDELDFTVDQKVNILKDILAKNPATFLVRFGKHISAEDLVYFQNLDKTINNYELNFRINELKTFFNDKKKHINVQNRRYEALRRLEKDSNYFNESEMRRRNPLLYEQYIGQYLTEEEKLARDRAEQESHPSLSDILLQRFDSQKTEWIFQYQKEREEECVEEDSDSDSDDHTDSDCVTSPIKGIPSEAERQLLKEEFLSEMQAKFLAGQDEEFDYSKVDLNDDYDDLQLREQDEEEAYFDGDDEENDSQMTEI